MWVFKMMSFQDPIKGKGENDDIWLKNKIPHESQIKRVVRELCDLKTDFSWSWITPMVIEQVPELFRKHHKTAIEECCSGQNWKLLEKILDVLDWSKWSLANQTTKDELRLISNDHPISLIYYARKSTNNQADESISVALSVMRNKGCLSDVLRTDLNIFMDPSHVEPFVFQIARHKMTESMLLLLKEGLDPKIQLEDGRTLIDFCNWLPNDQDGGNKIYSLLKAWSAQKDANQAIMELMQNKENSSMFVTFKN